MDAPPNIDPATLHSDSEIVHWLMNNRKNKEENLPNKNLLCKSPKT